MSHATRICQIVTLAQNIPEFANCVMKRRNPICGWSTVLGFLYSITTTEVRIRKDELTPVNQCSSRAPMCSLTPSAKHFQTRTPPIKAGEHFRKNDKFRNSFIPYQGRKYHASPKTSKMRPIVPCERVARPHQPQQYSSSPTMTQIHKGILVA